MKINELIKIIEEYYPLGLQENYDNSGVQLGDTSLELKGAIITLDISEATIDEAINKGANMIISHHPLIFSPIKKITNNYIDKIITKSIKNDIVIYSMHTNLDNHWEGINKIMALKLNLKNIKTLSAKGELLRKLVTFVPIESIDKVRDAVFSAGAGVIGNYDKCSYNVEGYGTFRPQSGTNPYVGKINELHKEKEIRLEVIYAVYKEKNIITSLLNTHPYEEVAYDIYKLENKMAIVGSGIIGDLEEEIKDGLLLGKIKDVFNAKCIRHSKLLNKNVNKVAICGGSGQFLLKDAIIQGADFLITSDVKYHTFFETEDKIVIADVGHFETEQFAIEIIYNYLIKKIPNFAIYYSDVITNPVNYFI